MGNSRQRGWSVERDTDAARRLDELDADWLAEEAFAGGELGATPRALLTGEIPDIGFDLAVPAPQPVALRKLHELRGQKLPPDVEAFLGERDPFLLAWELGLSAKPGERLKSVYSLCFDITLEDPNATILGYAPPTRTRTQLTATTNVDVGVSLSGSIDAIELAGGGSPIPIPGLSLTSAKAISSANAGLSFAMSLTTYAVEIDAKKISANQNRWQFYRATDQLLRPLTLLQTILVPKSVSRVDVTVETAVTLPKRFLGLASGRTLFYEPDRFAVSLTGLR